MITNKKNELTEDSWNQWLAGLIDGDGCLLISKEGYASLEITMDIYDEHALLQVKQKLGGSVKPRSSARVFRYRLHHKKGMLLLLERINGYCINSKRVEQLKRMCLHYNLLFLEPENLTLENGWFAGFFDADGTIYYSLKKKHKKPPSAQLTISASNKKAIDLKPFADVFGGYIRLDKKSNTYRWEIQTKKEILFFCEYLKKYPLRSHKKRRLFLIDRYYELRECNAYRQNPESLLYKAWLKFEEDWKYTNY